jgi:hypothetical protein
MTVRLGVQLTVKSGREAAVRLIVMSAAVAIGSTLLLCTLAGFHALRAGAQQPCWECTSGTAVQSAHLSGVRPRGAGSLLWLARDDNFEGKAIHRADMAALGPHAPLPPGISALPAAGEYDASPALARLIAATPRGELGNRFPGRLVGLVGKRALDNPQALVAYVGRSPRFMRARPGTQLVRRIATEPDPNSLSSVFSFVLGIGAVGLFFPILILVGTATRLSASRREERFAALRLVGATGTQISSIAAVDALTSATLGAALGCLVFVAIRPAVVSIPFTGAPFFQSDFTPTAGGFIAVLLGVPSTATAAALLSLRRVHISPLGVAQHVTPNPPGARRVLPFAFGALLFITALLVAQGGKSTNAVFALVIAGFALMVFGLMVAGAWLTMVVSRLVARSVRSAPSLLAARRLADNPKAAFRSVSGLVLALFVGSVFSAFAAAGLARTPVDRQNSLTSTLVVRFFDGSHEGLSPQKSSAVLARLHRLRSVHVYPIYATATRPERSSGSAGHRGIIACSSLAQFPALTQCPKGAQAATLNSGDLAAYLHTFQVTAAPAAVFASHHSAQLQVLLLRAGSAAALERARTMLISRTTPTAPARTFGEAQAAQLSTLILLQRLVYVGFAITMLIAACSLAVSIGSGLVERKRPFALLRLAGTSVAVLNRVVLLESAAPLVAVAVVSAVAGLCVGAAMTLAIGVNLHPTLPSPGYVVTITVGLAASFAVIGATLPLLDRLTQLESTRFE